MTRTSWLRRLRLAAVATIALALMAMPAAAQDTGAIFGIVVDSSGQVVPGATVLLTSERSGDARTLTSDDRGEFAFRAITPGSYTIRVELAGFRAFERTNNVLNASGQLDIGRVTLEVGTLNEVITVSSTGTPVETTNSDYSGQLTSTQMSQMQTRGRDVMSLLKLLPGVRPDADIDAMGDSFGSNVPNINGMRRAWNQVTVDGLNGNELSGTSRFSSAINIDAISEVKVLLNTYKAEFGRTGGANVEIVSKSGGTDYHGSLYWYGRRDKWNANSWEANRAGTPKAKLHIDTYGLNVGGPVRIPKLVGDGAEKRMFFFYSLEAPQVQRPGPLRLFRVPTEAERRGDFSQSIDTTGRAVTVVDPVTHQPFPGNIIPANRIDPNTQKLLNMLPLPNRPGESFTYNFSRQETSENPRMNNLLRIDSRTSRNDTIWVTGRTFMSNQYGSEITAAPARWGFFNGAYLFGDNSVNGGWNRVFNASLVNEFQSGVRTQTEGFQTKDDSDWTRIRRSDVGWTMSQFNPSLNTLDVIPRVTFGLNVTGTDPPDFTYDNRLGNTARDWIYSARDNVTWTRGAHTVKAGGYLEYMQNNEARGGNWMGEFQFNRNTNNPLDTGFAYSNALLGVFSQYTETDRYRETRNRAWMSEWFAQDTWRSNSRMTFDYGARFLWYTPFVRVDDQVANFDPARYDPKKAPRLYVPALINGTRAAFDPVTGQSANAVLIGAYVPGSGDENNGMVRAGDGVPRGFRATLAPQIEPRAGFAWDLTGQGTTVVHASTGLFHNARLGGGNLGNLSGNPPFIHNPIYFYGTTAQLLSGGTTVANRPAMIEAIEWDYRTPYAINWSIGIRRDIGWGTVVDAAYVGNVGRNLEMYYDLNPVPAEARYLDIHPENRDPAGSATALLPPEFLRPYRGYQNIRTRGNSGNAKYHSLQIQANRRYIRHFQFGATYTLQRARGVADEDPGNLSYTLDRPIDFYYGNLVQSQTHNLGVHYMWDLPKSNKGALAGLLLDGWQLSGSNAFITGEWAPVFFTTPDNFDFTGGEGGQSTDLGGGLRNVRPIVIGNPMDGGGDPLTGWFNVNAFKRPTGRGDYGNAPRNAIQRPGINNWNVAIFKNFAAGGTRTLQFRCEAYNVLNQVQFIDVDRTAVFDATGKQTKPTFGTAYGINEPTAKPRLIQLSARFSF
jgi:carboxypeptidase family protein/TonB-dependent receptor-like protein